MKTFNKKSSIMLAILLIGTIVISSCKRDDPEPIVYGNANLRVVNAVPSSADQDFYQGDTKLSTSPIAYGNYSGYLVAKAGPSTISYRNTGTTSVTSSLGAGLETNASYTVFLFSNANGNPQITGFEDDPTPPTTGKVRVRFLNLGGALNNTLRVGIAATGGATLTNGLAYSYISGYSTIDPGQDLSVTVLNAATSTTIPGANFIAGKIYTVWFDAATATSANFHIIVQN